MFQALSRAKSESLRPLEAMINKLKFYFENQPSKRQRVAAGCCGGDAGPCSILPDSAEPPSAMSILDLPTEMLLAVLDQLPAHDVALARAVCRSFKVAGDTVLDLRFSRLLPLIEAQQAALSEEDQQVQPDGRWDKQVVRRQLSLIRRRWLLNTLAHQLCLLRAICLRYLSVSPLSEGGCGWRRCSFYGGRVLDEAARLVRAAAQQRPTWRHEEAEDFRRLAHRWVDHFHDTTEPALLAPALSDDADDRGGPQPALFGAKLLDLLDCCVNSQRELCVSWDNAGEWCSVSGRYVVWGAVLSCVSSARCEQEPLSEQEQRSLHECVRLLAGRSAEYQHAQAALQREARLPDAGSPRVLTATYEGVNRCGATLVYYGYVSQQGLRRLARQGHGSGPPPAPRDVFVAVHVALRCRRHLAPLSALRDAPVRRPGHVGEGGAVWGRPELVLRLRFSCPAAERFSNRLPPDYRCLIVQTAPQAGDRGPPAPLPVINRSVRSRRRGHLWL